MDEFFPVQRSRHSRSDLQNSRYLVDRGEALLAQMKFQEAIASFEQALRLKKVLFGADHRDTRKCCKDVTTKVVGALKLTYSVSDPTALAHCLHHLEKALSLFPTALVCSELCEVYSALAFAYRQLTNYELARMFTAKALALCEEHPSTASHRAGLCLSMCAILSAQNDHRSALDFAKQCLHAAESQPLTDDNITLLAVANHNIAVEEEHFSHYSKAISSYRKAVKVLEDHGGEAHLGLLGDMRKSMQDALAQYAQKGHRVEDTRRLQSLTLTASVRHSEPNKLFTTETTISDSHSPRVYSALGHYPKPRIKSQTSLHEFRSLFENRTPRSRFTVKEEKKKAGEERTVQFSCTTPQAASQLRLDPDRELANLDVRGFSEFGLDSPTTYTERNRKRVRGKKRLFTSTRTACISPRTEETQGRWIHGRTPSDLAVLDIDWSAQVTPTHSNPLFSPTPQIPATVTETIDSAGEVLGSETPSEVMQEQPSFEALQTQRFHCKSEVPKTIQIVSPLMEKEPETDANTLAAVKIQRLYRAVRARKVVELMKKQITHSKLVVKRSGKRLRNGQYAVVTVYRDGGLYTAVATVLGEEVPIAQLSKPINEFASPMLLLQEIDCEVSLEAVAISPDYSSTSKDSCSATKMAAAVVTLQRVARGWEARRHFALLRKAEIRRMKVVYRGGVKINDMFLTATVVDCTPEGQKVVIYDATHKTTVEKPVPEPYSTLPPALLLQKLSQGDDSDYSFSPLNQSSVSSLRSQSPLQSPAAVTGTRSCEVLPTLRRKKVVRTESCVSAVSCALEKQTTTGSVKDLTDAAMKVVFKGEKKKGERCTYTILIYEHAKNLMLQAFAPWDGSLKPSSILLAKGRMYAKSPKQYCELLLERLCISDEGEIVIPVPLHSHSPSLWTTNSQSLPSETHSSIICIQSHIRGFLTRKRYQEQRRWRKGRNTVLFRGFRKLRDDGPIFAVQISRFDELVTAIASSVVSSEAYSLIFTQQQLSSLELGDSQYSGLYARLYISRNRLEVSPGRTALLRAAIIIQKWVRGRTGRATARARRYRANRKPVLTRRKVQNAEEFYISLHERDGKVQVEVFKLYTKMRLKYSQKCAVYTEQEIEKMYGFLPAPEALFDDVYFSSAQVCIRPRNRILPDKAQEISSPRMITAVNSPGLDPNSSSRFILRTSRKLDGQMWVVTMSLVHSNEIVEFKAFSAGAQNPLSAHIPLQELSARIRLPIDSIISIGNIAIKKILKIKDGELVLDLESDVPDVNKLASLMQAYARGFIIRRRYGRIPKGNLITCQLISLDNAQWVFYAYREPPAIHVEAARRRSKESVSVYISTAIFTKFPPTLSNKRVIENFVFPKLSISEENQQRHLRVTKSIQMENLLEKHKEKIKVISGSHKNRFQMRSGDKYIQSLIDEGKSTHNRPPPLQTEGLADASAQLSQADLSDISPVLERNTSSSKSQRGSIIARKSVEGRLSMGIVPIKIEISQALSSSSSSSSSRNTVIEHSQESSLNLSTDSRLRQRLPMQSYSLPQEEESSSISVTRVKGELVLRSPLTLSGVNYQASIYQSSSDYCIELENFETGETALTWVDSEGPHPDSEAYCEELLSRVTITHTGDKLDIALKPKPMQILYKRSHYVSNRYCTIIIASAREGMIEVQAFDPVSKKTYNLHMQWRLPEGKLLQRELADLVGKLHIVQGPAGEEMQVQL